MRARKRLSGWLIFTDVVVLCVVLYYLVPVTQPYFRSMVGLRKPDWPMEPYYIAAWNRDLSHFEVGELVRDIGDQFYFKQIYHLIHHGDERRVVEALLEATEDERSIRSIGAEVALYKIGNEPDQRWARLLDTLRTGGLGENQTYVLDLSYEELIEDVLLFRRGRAGADVEHVMWLLALNLEPTEDSHRIPDLLQVLESETAYIREAAVYVLSIFRDNPSVKNALEDVAENDSSESVRYYAAHVLERELPPYPSYNEQIQVNRRGFVIAMLLIAAMIVGWVVILRLLPREPN